MFRIWITIPFLFVFSFIHGQVNTTELQAILEEGVRHYDKGEYKEAEKDFKKVLVLDKNNVYALYELAYTYETTQRFKEAIALAKKGLKLKDLSKAVRAQFYVLQGNCLDKSVSAKKAIKAYQKGLTEFPNYYLLHFNVGVTYLAQGELETAKVHFIEGVKNNPTHASSHYYLSLICKNLNERIPSILSAARFLYLNPESPRAELMQTVLPNLVRGNQKEDEINYDIAKENSFLQLEMLLDLSTLQQKVTTVELTVNSPAFLVNFKLLCEGLKSHTTKEDFFWTYYAPYFYAIAAKDLVEGFVALIGDPKLEKVKERKAELAAEIKRIRLFTEEYSF